MAFFFFVADASTLLAADVAVSTERGLHAVSYTTLQGTVRVYLPDDMSAGDTISGTIAVEPAGATSEERTANTGVLRGTVIDLDGQKSTAATPVFKMHVPEGVRNSVPIAFSLAAVNSSHQPATSNVPLISQAAAESMAHRIAETPGQFNWPPAVPQSAPATIRGPFDGDSSNTRLDVGRAGATVLAESPRQAVFQLPASAIAGPTTLKLTEGNTTVTGPVRSVKVQLSAPKTNLRKGERTELTVEVAGLQGLTHPIPLQLRTGGVVTAAGGNLQHFEISPNDPGVAANGVFRTTRTLTGVSAGGFEVVAEVAWAHPAQSWFAGKTVHVEGEPGGQPGRWRVPVIVAGDPTQYPVYFGGEKRPNLHYCNWIEVKAGEEKDGIDYITDYVRTTDPTKKPKTEPKAGGTKALPPAPAGPTATGGSTTTEPPPCKDGDLRILSSEEKKFTLLDGKQELFTQVYTDKDGAAVAAGDFAAYLKKIAELGGKAGEHLPEGDGAGGAVVGFLLKYLEQGGAVIDEVLKGKLKLAGASTFTAVMDVGLRDVVATCTTVEICVRGTRVTEKRFTQTESKRREKFVKKASKGDDEWEKISDSSGHIDPEKAAKWAKDFFTEMANILKGNADDLKKFKDACK